MPSKALDHVHRLIHAMDRAEKRYFKLYTSRHMPGGKSANQRLFDAIAAMEQYDEAALLHRFRHEPFARRFAITKRRLYETILRSLDAFHAERSVDDRLRRRLHEVELLHRKALYADARKHLESVRKLAREHERHTALLEVNDWERRLVERVNYAGCDPDIGEQLAEQAAQLHDELLKIDRLWALKSRVFVTIYRKGARPAAAQGDPLPDALNTPLLKGARGKGSSRARYLYHHIHAAAAFNKGDLALSDEHLAANHTLLITRRAHFADAEQLLFAVLSNRVYIRSRMGDTKGTQQLLKEFEHWPRTWSEPGATDLRLRVFATVTSLRLALLADSGDFDQAIALMPGILEGLREHEADMSPLRRASLFLQLAFIHFGAGQLEPALRWINRQLNEPEAEGHGESYHLGRMLNLMIQAEQMRADLLPYTLRNLGRYLRSVGGACQVEHALLAYARTCMERSGTAAHHTALDQLAKALREGMDDPRARTLITHLKLDDWLEAKRSARSFAEVIKAHHPSAAQAA